ncbi:MAG TPA: chemotaxis protein CheW, partial [Phenylobacterium sp.]|nr:chemotaxis protein CheW [Phenylobacterium sp.]
MSPADDSYLLIDLGGQAFALPMNSVREVLPLPVLDRQPPWPKILAGMINLRGQAMPVLDLGLLLSAGADRETTDL